MIEFIDNLTQLLAALSGCVLSGVLYLKSRRQPYFLLCCFYGCFGSGMLYWLLYTLLKQSRLDADMVVFQRAPVAVDDLVRAALRPFLLSFELHSITLETDLSPGATWMGDRHWLTEALQNLLKNALDSMQDHGCLQIRCEDTLLFTQLTLHDSGPGFAPADLPHLFHRFYRGTGTGNTTGYGIGLSLCKTIITQQGGQITADNHPQGGAVFTIRFPK